MPVLVLFSILLPAVAEAAQGSTAGSLESVLRLLGALGMILGMILLLYAGSRRGLSWLPKAGGGAIRILETRPLGPKKSLCLVQVRDQELLLGVSADRIELLCQVAPAATSPFDDALQRQMEGLS